MASRKVARFKGRKFRKHTTCQRAEIRVDCKTGFQKVPQVYKEKACIPVKAEMLAGRTLCRLQNLQRMSLLSTLRGLDSGASNIQPAAGLTATLKGQAVLILDSFLRRGRQFAHVAPIVPTSNKKPPGGADSFLDRRKAQTCRADDLQDLGLGWQVVGFVRDTTYLARTSLTSPSLVVTADVLEVWEGLHSAACASAGVYRPSDEQALAPGSVGVGALVVLSMAAEQHLKSNPDHKLVPIGRTKEPEFVLDIPYPRLLDMSQRRCETCLQTGVSRTFCPCAADVQRAAPHVVVHKNPPHLKRVRYMSQAYLLNLLLAIYDLFNLRGLLRPQSLGAMALSLPSTEEIKVIALKAFAAFVEKQVDMMTKQQMLFNCSIIRGDGHYDLAARVYQYDAKNRKRTYPFTCLMAWCGTDGSLLKPFVLTPGEAFQDQVRDLEPFLRAAKRIRMSHGMSSEESRPTVHATDTYGKHRLLWPPVYDQIWLEQEVEAVGRTKKGDVKTIHRRAAPSHVTMITGEPMHELINLRRVLPRQGHDFAEIYFDHADAVARDAEAAEALRQFLGSSGVAKHPVWKEVFGVDVHGNVGFYNYSSKKEFKREVRRIRDWYGARRVRSPARSIMNAKVKLHYARLLNKTRVQGLWRWRAAALAMLDAGLPMQTGTVAVERLWAQVQAIFPPQGRGMSLAWFQLLSNLAYLRVNYNHYNGASLPPWCKHDAVLKQSLDGLLSLALSFSQDDERLPQILEDLSSPFRTTEQEAGHHEEYLKGSLSFDSVDISRVYDLRGHDLTWSKLGEILGSQMPKQTQGAAETAGSDPKPATVAAVAGTQACSQCRGRSHENVRASAAMKMRGAGCAMPDPTQEILLQLRQAVTEEQFEDLLFHDRLFEGMRNKDETYETIKANLASAWQDTRTHRQLAAEADFDIRLCAADAHKVFRSVQFLRTYLPNDLASSARAAKADISLDDFTVALHKWMVQLRWHFGSYRCGIKASCPLCRATCAPQKLLPLLHYASAEKKTNRDAAFHMYLVLSGTFAFVARPERATKSPRASAARRARDASRGEGRDPHKKTAELRWEMWPYQLFSHSSYFGNFELHSGLKQFRRTTARCESEFGQALRLQREHYHRLCGEFPQFAGAWNYEAQRREALRVRLLSQHTKMHNYRILAARRVQKYVRQRWKLAREAILQGEVSPREVQPDICMDMRRTSWHSSSGEASETLASLSIGSVCHQRSDNNVVLRHMPGSPADRMGIERRPKMEEELLMRQQQLQASVTALKASAEVQVGAAFRAEGSFHVIFLLALPTLARRQLSDRNEMELRAESDLDTSLQRKAPRPSAWLAREPDASLTLQEKATGCVKSLERDALGAHSYTDLTQIDVDWISEYLDEMMEKVLEPERQANTYARTLPPSEAYVIIGDLHGQLFNLLSFLHKARMTWLPPEEGIEPLQPSMDFVCSPEKVRYVFLGDYVDRGERSIETAMLVLSYKVLCPDGIVLLQGNHEDALMNENYGFQDEVRMKFDGDTGVWTKFNAAFGMLPYLAVKQGHFIAMHGGLSEEFVHLCSHSQTGTPETQHVDFNSCLGLPSKRHAVVAEEITWSDPRRELTRFGPSQRGEGVESFGPLAAREFLQEHQLKYLFRGHEQKNQGFEEMHVGDNRSVVTIFSAADYVGQFCVEHNRGLKHVPWFPAKRGMGNMGGVAVYRPEHQVLQIVLLSGHQSREMARNLTGASCREFGGSWLQGGSSEGSRAGDPGLELPECDRLQPREMAAYRAEVEKELQNASSTLFEARTLVDLQGEALVRNATSRGLCVTLAKDSITERAMKVKTAGDRDALELLEEDMQAEQMEQMRRDLRYALQELRRPSATSSMQSTMPSTPPSKRGSKSSNAGKASEPSTRKYL
ncbi:unnamed protein product [Effrenium voratum]|nr:unnamed protein product [Effrenium voratum]